MSRPRVACCTPFSGRGPARLHWFHADDCVLTPRREIEPKSTHPADADEEHDLANLPWRLHPKGCLCEQCVYVELNVDRDDDTSDIERGA